MILDIVYLEDHMNKLVLGLDIGITSVGYGVIDMESNDFVDYGVRLFKEGTAEDNEKRRTARSRRRLLSRRHTRIEDMKKLLKQYGIIDEDYRPLPHVYELRMKGLTQKLSNDELASAILHLVKHRGSSIETVDDNEEGAKETEKAKEVLGKNAKLLAEGKFVCEVQYARLQEGGSVRGHDNNFKTKDYVAEAEEILRHQDIDETLKKKIILMIQRKRAYYEGPGSEKSPTPYGRFILEDGKIKQIDLIEKMIGRCSVFPDELRAPKLSISAELFNFLNDLNNLTIKEEKITPEQKEEVLQHISKKGNITFKQLLKKLNVDQEDVHGYRIDKNGKPLLTEFKGYKKLRSIFEGAGESVSLEDVELLDKVMEIVTKCKGIEERKQALQKLGLTSSVIEPLSELTGITGYHALSFKALRMLNQEMYQSDRNQMQLLHEMKLFDQQRKSHKGEKNITADDEAILSPVARRAQHEAFKVVNQLRRIYGEFDSIVVEMTREKNSSEHRKNIQERQKYFESRNKKVDELLSDRGLDPEKVNGKTKLKIRLYQEQDGKSAYTLQPLDLDRIIKDQTYTEIDHIIPVSISLDDSQNNKVLITRTENQLKGNLTPLGAYQKGRFAGLNCTMSHYIETVKGMKNISSKKRRNLLFSEDITKYSVIQQFINRNLVDTSYACRVVLNTLSDYFKDNGIDTKVHTINGRLTDKFRQQINLPKDRDEDYLHHAIDALIVASIKKLNLLKGYLSQFTLDEMYDEKTGEIKEIPGEESFFDPAYIRYISDLKTIYQQSSQYYRGIIDRSIMAYPPIKISHKINTKPNRQVSDETIYSTRELDGKEMIIQKYKDIYDPKFKALTQDILNGKVERYLMARNDPQTFESIAEIIRHHYEQFKDSKDHYKMKSGKIELVGENPLTAYKEEFGPVKKYSKKGNGPAITSMKYADGKLGSHIDISQNYRSDHKRVILKQVSPYRTDFYLCSDGKYRFVTIRYKDIFYKAEKQKYVIDREWYLQEKARKKIDDKAKFVCSLHRDELIGITKKYGDKFIYDESTENGGDTLYHDGVHPEILKFTATNNDETNRIEVKPTYTYCKKQLMVAVASFTSLRKFTTDVLGNLYEVKQNVLKMEFE